MEYTKAFRLQRHSGTLGSVSGGSVLGTGMKWYYAEAGQQKGPVNGKSLDQLVTQGVVPDDTLVWSEGMSRWQPYASVRGTRAAQTPPFPPATAACAMPAPVIPAVRYYDDLTRVIYSR